MLAKIAVADYMATRIVTLKPDTQVLIAIKQLLAHKITSAPVLSNTGEFMGMFSEKDCMKVVLETSYNQGMSGIVSDYMSEDVTSVKAEDSIIDVAEKFQGHSVRSYPVFANNKLIGIVSRTDVLKALVS